MHIDPDTLTDAEFEAEYRGIWTEQSTPPCLYAVDPAAGKTRTENAQSLQDVRSHLSSSRSRRIFA